VVVLVAAKAVITDEVSAVGTPDTPRGRVGWEKVI